jgi:hypothetical protein
VAEPVLLISSDPFLGASVEAVAHGRLRVARLDPSRRPMVWPAGSTGTVVLDVTVRQRAVLHDWVRRHHPGPMVVLLKPGEQQLSLPPSPPQVVIGRPFRLADLVSVLEHPSFPPAAPAPDPDPPPRPPGPATAPPLPRPDWPTARTRLDVRRRRPWWRRPVVTRVLLGLLVLVVLAGAWLAIGLFEARRDLQVGAAAVRSELTTAETAWAAGHDKQAAKAVAAAERSLEATATVGDRRELRIVANLPLLSRNADDTRRLLAELSAELERTRGALDLRG